MHETPVRGILEKGKSHLQAPCRPERGGSIDELAAVSLHRTLEQVRSIWEANLTMKYIITRRFYGWSVSGCGFVVERKRGGSLSVLFRTYGCRTRSPAALAGLCDPCARPEQFPRGIPELVRRLSPRRFRSGDDRLLILVLSSLRRFPRNIPIKDETPFVATWIAVPAIHQRQPKAILRPCC